MQQADFLEQDADLEQVGHRFAMRDDVMLHHFAAESAMCRRDDLENGELGFGARGIFQMRRAQRPAAADFACQQFDPRLFAQRMVIGRYAGLCQQFRDGRLVFV